MITQDILHKLYLEELTNIDDTHGGRVKNKHPEHWDFLPYSQGVLIDLEQVITEAKRDIWLWSDQHFFHKNIIRYSNRPYDNIDMMNEQLVINHNSVVKPDDIVIWGGDIGFGNVSHINNFLDKCNGYKVHVLGNHDMYTRGDKYTMHQLNVNETHPCIALTLKNAQMLITHYPFNVVPDQCINVHGHTHTHPAFTNRHINISVEQINYTPINIKQIIEYSQTILSKD